MLSIKKCYFTIFLVLASFIYFVTNLNISNVPGTYVPHDLESYRVLKKSEKIFGNDETLIFVFKFSSQLNLSDLENLAKFVKALESEELVKRVHSIFDYESIRGNQDGFEVVNIIDKYNIKLSEKTDILEKVKTDRFVKDLLINKELDVFSIIIEPEFILNSLDRFGFENNIFELIKKNKLEGLQIAYGGDFAIDMVQFRESLNLMLKIIPIVIIVGLVLIYLMFNSFIGVLFAFLINSIGTYFSISLLSFLKFDYNLITSVIPTLMLALSTAFIIHLYNNILRLNQTKPIHDSIQLALIEIRKPSLYSAITTAIGLYALAFSSIPPLVAVGVVCGTGVLFIYFLVIHILPRFLIQFCRNDWKQNQILSLSLDRIIEFFTHLALSYPRRIVGVFFLVMFLLSFQIYSVKSETNLYKFFPTNHSINNSIKNIKKHFVGVTNLTILFSFDDKDEKQQLLEPSFLKALKSAKTKILQIANVDRVFSAVDIIKQINWAFKAEDPNEYSIPFSKELIDQYLFVYDGEDLYDYVDRDFEFFKMSINLNKEGAREVNLVYENVYNVLKEELKDYSVKVEYGGYGKVFADQEKLVIEDLFRSIYISSIVIFLVMCFIWKSVKDSIFCMIPNFSPILSMFILMGIFNIWLDIGTAMIASIALGIAVDDTIHIFSGFKKRVQKHTVEDSIKLTFEDSGRAIIITTFILASQFFVLALSDFKPLQFFGVLTSAGLFIALIFDLMLLPALILLTSKK
jgi:predicted RND superfamily exporter protein